MRIELNVQGGAAEMDRLFDVLKAAGYRAYPTRFEQPDLTPSDDGTAEATVSITPVQPVGPDPVVLQADSCRLTFNRKQRVVVLMVPYTAPGAVCVDVLSFLTAHTHQAAVCEWAKKHGATKSWRRIWVPVIQEVCGLLL